MESQSVRQNKYYAYRYDQFDFLIDIVPRDDVKPVSGGQASAPAANPAAGAAAAPGSGFFLQQQAGQATAQPQVQVLKATRLARSQGSSSRGCPLVPGSAGRAAGCCRCDGSRHGAASGDPTSADSDGQSTDAASAGKHPDRPDDRRAQRPSPANSHPAHARATGHDSATNDRYARGLTNQEFLFESVYYRMVFNHSWMVLTRTSTRWQFINYEISCITAPKLIAGAQQSPLVIQTAPIQAANLPAAQQAQVSQQNQAQTVVTSTASGQVVQTQQIQGMQNQVFISE